VLDVYLIRHAIAENRDAVRWPDDSLRPLTERGAERFVRAARGLRGLVPTVELVLSSPYVRAWQTAEILEQEAGWPAPEPCDALGAARSPADALGLLRERGSVALVGHEPYLSSVASLLLAGDGGAVGIELKKGGVIALAFGAEPAAGTALLRWSASPKLLRATALA
jgi:phosphohistidine phosphatase